MRVALVVGQTVPNPDSGGSALLTWTLARHALEQGHEVVVLPLLDADYVEPTGLGLERRVEQLEAAGAEVEVVRSRAAEARPEPRAATLAEARHWLDPPDEWLFPTLADRDSMRDALARARPDVVLGYHWEALAALDGVHLAPKLGTAVDLAHLPLFHIWLRTLRRRPKQAVRITPFVLSLVRLEPSLMVRFLNDCEASADFAAHHAAWLRRHGAGRCEFLRMPIPDPGPPPPRAPRSGRPRFLLLGHLRGTATIAGLALFTRDVLPRLERALGADGFEVRIVGGYEPPPELSAALDRPSVTRCGFVEDVGEELRTADVVVVPTPIKLGTRVRILTAFAHGAAAVAHTANACGIPDLVDGDNVLLGRNGRELATAVLRLAGDEELRGRLRTRARATYESLYAPSAAGSRILSVLSQLADAD